MNAIISFFSGMAILMSGDEIGLLAGTYFGSLVCNILGSCIMAYGAKLFLDEAKEQWRHYNNIEKALSIINESILNSTTETVNQKKEIKSTFELQIKKVIDLNEQLNQMMKASLIQLESLYSEFEKTNETIITVDNNNRNEIKSMSECMVNVTQDTIKQLERIIDLLEGFKELPNTLIENADNVYKSVKDYTADISTKLRYLTEDISDENMKQSNNFKKCFENLVIH